MEADSLTCDWCVITNHNCSPNNILRAVDYTRRSRAWLCL